jgi:hypothetical protein
MFVAADLPFDIVKALHNPSGTIVAQSSLVNGPT